MVRSRYRVTHSHGNKAPTDTHIHMVRSRYRLTHSHGNKAPTDTHIHMVRSRYRLTRSYGNEAPTDTHIHMVRSRCRLWTSCLQLIQKSSLKVAAIHPFTRQNLKGVLPWQRAAVLSSAPRWCSRPGGRRKPYPAPRCDWRPAPATWATHTMGGRKGFI